MLYPTLLDRNFTKRTDPERLISSKPVFLQITNYSNLSEIMLSNVA